MEKKISACSNTECNGYEKGAVDKTAEGKVSNCILFYINDFVECPAYIPTPPIDLNTKTPIIVTEDIKVWVWDDHFEVIKQRYLALIDPRGEYPYGCWIQGMTGNMCNHYYGQMRLWKNVSFTDPRKPKPITITLNGKDIELSAESYQNLKDHFNGLED